MAITELHIGSGNRLYYKNGTAVKYNGYPVKRSDSSNTTWYTTGSGREIKEYRDKTIFDLANMLGFGLCFITILEIWEAMLPFFYKMKI